jgi:hypothetical protein
VLEIDAATYLLPRAVANTDGRFDPENFLKKLEPARGLEPRTC